MPARGRLRLSDEDRIESLDTGWWWAGSPPGLWTSPLTVMRLSQGADWYPAERLASVAAMRDPSALHGPVQDPGSADWWMCRPLYPEGRPADGGASILELDGLAGTAELWLHEVAEGRERRLLAGSDKIGRAHV